MSAEFGLGTLAQRAALAAAILAAGAALCVRSVGATSAGVLGSSLVRLEPRRVSTRWVFVLPPFLRLYRYPLADLSLTFRFPRDGAEPFATREGSAVGAEGSLTVRAIDDKILDLHRRHGEAFLDTLVRPALRAALGRMIAEEGYDGVRGRGVLSLEGRVTGELRHALEAEGVSVQALRLERLELGASADGAQALGRPARQGARVLLVGLDGADWNLIDPLRAAGRLPNLDAILKRGAGARLRTISPVLSPVLWTSIATGKKPEKHGIVDFLATSRETGEKVPVTSNLRRARPLWQILGDYGLRSNVIAWWATWPAEPLRGALVTDRVAYQLFGIEGDRNDPSGKTYPPALYERIRPLVRTPAEVSQADLERFIPALGRERLEKRYPDLIQEFRTLLASTQSYSAIALQLIRGEPADFQAVYLEGIDTASHLFMRYRPPRVEGVSAQEVAWFGQVVDRFYEYQDELLGSLLAAAGKGATVVVCSDHGFRSDQNRPPGDARIAAGRAAEWHRKYGILALAGSEVVSGTHLPDASILDVAPTLLELFGLPVAEDFDGRVLREALRPEFLAGFPPRTVVTYEPSVLKRVSEDPIASAADAAIRQKLTSLGYLSLEGSNADNNRGTLFLSEGRSDEAIAAYEAALRSDPDFLPVRINLGRAYMQKKEYGRALEIFQEVLRRKPDLPEVENLAGNILMEMGDLAAAEGRFRRAVQIDPHFTDARNSLGILYEKLGRFEEAQSAYREVVRIDPDYAEAYNNLGNLLRARGRWEEAVRLYKRAIAADADFDGSYNNLGLAYEERGLHPQAEEVLRRGVEKSPRNPILHSSLGSVQYAAGRYEEAVAEFRRAVELDPGYSAAHNNLGAALGRLGRGAEQEAEYRKAVELAPRYSDARYNLALILMARGERAAALEELRRVVEATPEHVESWLQLAVLYEQAGELGEAIRALETAKGLEPLRPLIYNRLGDLYGKVGQPERARREWRRSLEIAPRQPAIRDRLEQEHTTGE
jgi:tetratricopeptide (TPR) repeat protein